MSCRCGHDRGAHEHYRPGSDCGGCECPRYRISWREVGRDVLAAGYGVRLLTRALFEHGRRS